MHTLRIQASWRFMGETHVDISGCGIYHRPLRIADLTFLISGMFSIAASEHAAVLGGPGQLYNSSRGPVAACELHRLPYCARPRRHGGLLCLGCSLVDISEITARSCISAGDDTPCYLSYLLGKWRRSHSLLIKSRIHGTMGIHTPGPFSPCHDVIDANAHRVC